MRFDSVSHRLSPGYLTERSLPQLDTFQKQRNGRHEIHA